MKISELRQICQNSGAPDWRTQSIEGKINRIFSIYLTWVLIKLPFTPNQITILGTTIFLAGSALFIKNSFWFNIAGLFLILFSYILDACDGELARFRKISQLNIGGNYVEPVSHDIQYGFFFLFISIGASLKLDSFLPLIFGFLGTSGKLLSRLLEFRSDALKRYLDEVRGKIYGISEKKSEAPKSIVFFAYRNLFTSTGVFFPLVIFTLLNKTEYFVYFYGSAFILLWFYSFLRKSARVKKYAKEFNLHSQREDTNREGARRPDNENV